MYIDIINQLEQITNKKYPRKKINYVEQIEKDLMHVSYLKGEIDPLLMMDILTGIKNFAKSVESPSLETVQRVHPISRKPRLEGYDYISDFKAMAREYLKLYKIREGVKITAFYDFWVVPLAEKYRSCTRLQFINFISDHCDNFYEKVNTFYLSDSDRYKPYESKQRLLDLARSRNNARHHAQQIIDKRLRNEIDND